MLLPTSLVGSYPQPEWLIDRERLSKQVPRVRMHDLWLVPEKHLEAAQDDATLLAIRDQERAGLDIICDGEQRRESYSNRFATALEGIDLDKPGTTINRYGQADPGAARRRQDQAQASGRGARRENPARQYRPQDQGHGAWSLHHGQAGAGRFLQGRSRGRDGLCGGCERGDQGSVRGRRRHRADRRAVDAAASGQGAAIRTEDACSARSTA